MRKAIVVIAALAVAAACQDGTGPEELSCPNPDVQLCNAVPDVVAVAQTAVFDIGVRNAKGLSDAIRGKVQAQASALARALDDGHITRARDALALMRAAVAEGRAQLTAHPGDSPDLSAIELSLRPAAELIK